MASFAVQKLLSLNRSHLFIFISITLGDGVEKKYCRDLCQFSAIIFLKFYFTHSYLNH